MQFGIEKVLVCTYQAISGAGKTFERWPEMVDNLIPYIGGEEEKSEQEPLKVWGKVEDGKIVKAAGPAITAQCLRVPVSDGHTAAVFVTFAISPLWRRSGDLEELQGPGPGAGPPPAPKQFLHYFEEPDRPQARLDRDLEGGMAISWAVCGPIPSTTTSSWACPTTPCGAPPAPSCWPSCCARKGYI